ncbi:MAG: Re/Si-specific NAD(P)(+) transhydrogenase subunit alpha [Fimbriimonas ginsengisoli]|uniref:proton-translocating NAD(P)(+) transhydrogenase n=1 Tax=Fimbriimonas ginsengisoli TaxID=1005039 RepID=A0A931LR74_FIMGI|nr:Re/Si-specific NAD(P)(+) transhydrogenase subunit alpha [Fimbriimonas ginsengisoli]
MKIGVLAESEESEKRVALTPEGARTLREKGNAVLVEAGAGARAEFGDAAYAEAGAEIGKSAKAVAADSQLILRVLAPSNADTLAQGSALVSFLFPTENPGKVAKLTEKKVSAFAMDLMPRITRAQSMDALSSMSTIAGYRGALLAAERLPKFFPMLMTAAGTIPPAKVLVIGVGVAGLQATATCKRLGASVEAFDIRPAAKEQAESVGARFLAMPELMQQEQDASGYAREVEADAQTRLLEFLASKIAKFDAVITTALVPGKPAPKLVTKAMLAKMAPGSVLIDLAAANGGNCEATVKDQTVVVDGVTVVGSTGLLSDMASDASRMYSRNLVAFVLLLAPGGELKLDLDDEIISETLVTHDGLVRHAATRALLEKGGKS